MSLSGVTSRMLARNGHAMELRRVQLGGARVQDGVTGHMVAFSPQELTGEVKMGDARVTIGPILASLGEPRANDMLHDGSAAYRVMGKPQPIMVGAALDGWRLWVRGA